MIFHEIRENQFWSVAAFPMPHRGTWKRMRSGDRPGLQNRRAASFGFAGGFDSHSLPPVCNNLQTRKSTEITSKSVES